MITNRPFCPESVHESYSLIHKILTVYHVRLQVRNFSPINILLMVKLKVIERSILNTTYAETT